MKSLFDKNTLVETISRVEKLTPDITPIWGKMNAAQMMEHCARAFDYSTGKENPPRTFLGYILGPIFKTQYYNDKPWGKNAPTAKKYLVTNQPEFDATKLRLLNLVKEFGEGGEAKVTRHPSPFFGKLTPEQHGLGQYKHIDHHLQQFGV